jgi:hypothetical protein
MPYALYPSAALEGLSVDAVTDVVRSGTPEADGISAGRFVSKGTGDTKLKLPAAAGDVSATLEGVVMLNTLRDPLTAASNGGYKTTQPMAVKRHGVVWMLSETVCTKDQPVFVRFTTAGGGLDLGQVRNDSDTAKAGIAYGCRFLQTLTAPGLVLVELNVLAPTVGA